MDAVGVERSTDRSLRELLTCQLKQGPNGSMGALDCPVSTQVLLASFIHAAPHVVSAMRTAPTISAPKIPPCGKPLAGAISVRAAAPGGTVAGQMTTEYRLSASMRASESFAYAIH